MKSKKNYLSATSFVLLVLLFGCSNEFSNENLKIETSENSRFIPRRIAYCYANPNYDDSDGYEIIYDDRSHFAWPGKASSIKLTEYGKIKGIVLYSKRDKKGVSTYRLKDNVSDLRTIGFDNMATSYSFNDDVYEDSYAILYTETNFRGQNYRVDFSNGFTNFVGPHYMRGKTSSVKVYGDGILTLYSGYNQTKEFTQVDKNGIRDLKNLGFDNRTSCVSFSRVYKPYVILYDYEYQGDYRVISSDIDNLTEVNFNDRATTIRTFNTDGVKFYFHNRSYRNPYITVFGNRDLEYHNFDNNITRVDFL